MVRYLEGTFTEVAFVQAQGAVDIPVWIVDTHQWRNVRPELEDRNALYADLLAEFREENAGVVTQVASVAAADADFVSDFEHNLFVDPVYGHSRFIESIIDRLAPSAAIQHVPVMTNFGVTSDSVVEARLRQHWNDHGGGPGIVNLSLGTYSMDDETPLATRKLVADMRDDGWILVASAGNDASCRPMWPAASPEVVGVAATGPAGPAPFTNYGPWVNACAPGEDVVAIFPDAMIPTPRDAGDAPPEQGPELTENVPAEATPTAASWSGTSFATPAVVGAICHAAAALQPSDLVASPRDRLRVATENTVHDPALLRLPGLGTVVNVT